MRSLPLALSAHSARTPEGSVVEEPNRRIEAAVEWVSLPEMTAMLLERTHSVNLCIGLVKPHKSVKGIQAMNGSALTGCEGRGPPTVPIISLRGSEVSVRSMSRSRIRFAPHTLHGC